MSQRCVALLLVLSGCARADPRGNVTVYEYKIDSPVADIQWVGSDKKTVFVRSQKNFVYRSGDEGRSWELVTEDAGWAPRDGFAFGALEPCAVSFCGVGRVIAG